MNKVILIGRLTADPEVRYTKDDKAVASYRLAVDKPFKKDGQREADFISCVCFGNSGDFAANFLRKGMKVAVEGRINTRSYEKDGKTVYVTEVIVERHEFCESKSSAPVAVDKTPEPSAPVADSFAGMSMDADDLPF